MYTKEKFKQLTDQRRAQIILQSLYAIENEWENKPDTTQLKSYLSWLPNTSELIRFQTLGTSLNGSTTLRQLLNIIVPFERYLNKNLKDEDLLVRKKDFTNSKTATYPLYVVLDHLRSSFNVGSIFRSAECLGVKHIYLVGYTPTPEDLGVQKTAMGTEKLVSWSQHNHLSEVLQLLKGEGISLVALETSEYAQDLAEFSCPDKAAILLGNERFGLAPEVIHSADEVVHIPMNGHKNSLNVANTFSIVAYEFTRQLKEKK